MENKEPLEEETRTNANVLQVSAYLATDPPADFQVELEEAKKKQAMRRGYGCGENTEGRFENRADWFLDLSKPQLWGDAIEWLPDFLFPNYDEVEKGFCDSHHFAIMMEMEHNGLTCIALKIASPINKGMKDGLQVVEYSPSIDIIRNEGECPSYTVCYPDSEISSSFDIEVIGSREEAYELLSAWQDRLPYVGESETKHFAPNERGELVEVGLDELRELTSEGTSEAVGE